MNGYWERFTDSRIGRRRLLKGGAAISTGAAALALLGCGSDDGDSGGDTGTSSPTADQGDPVKGGRFGSYFSSVSNYNIVANYHDGYRVAGISVYDRLLTARLDKRQYVLEAAASAEIADGTKAILKLKPNMKFANKAPVNGHAVTSADILATQEYVKALPNAENSSFQRIFVDRMEAPDANTIIYHLKQPSAYLFSSTYLANPTAQPIIPKEMLDILDTTPAIGSGPWQLVDHTFNTRYLMRRFEEFRGAKDNQPYFDEIEFITLTDPVAQEAAFRSEQIHAWTPPASAAARLEADLDSTKFTAAHYLSTGITGMNVNMDPSKGVKPWHDIRVREAFYRMINREQFVTLVLDNRAAIPPGPVMAVSKPSSSKRRTPRSTSRTTSTRRSSSSAPRASTPTRPTKSSSRQRRRRTHSSPRFCSSSSPLQASRSTSRRCPSRSGCRSASRLETSTSSSVASRVVTRPRVPCATTTLTPSTSTTTSVSTRRTSTP